MKRFLSFAISIVILISLCSCSYVSVDNTQSDVTGELVVHFIDVGQGDSILLESDGDFVLIDAGETNYAQTVCDYLSSQQVTSIDYVIATHPHSDHCGGLTQVLNTYDCDNFITTETDQQTQTWLNVLYAVDDKGINYIDSQVGNTYSFGNSTFEIMGPYGTGYDDYNDYSVIVKATCGNTSFLFTGDAEKLVEKEMIEKGADLTADVLKVGHHGSYTSSCSEFLSAVDPAYAVISCGKDNDYGHPHSETMQKLSDLNITTYRTDTQGTIVAVSDSRTIKFYCGDTELATQAETTKATSSSTDSDVTYIGNKNSKKFHLDTCDGAASMNENNKVYFDTREQAVDEGYSPCLKCNP